MRIYIYVCIYVFKCTPRACINADVTIFIHTLCKCILHVYNIEGTN